MLRGSRKARPLDSGCALRRGAALGACGVRQEGGLRFAEAKSGDRSGGGEIGGWGMVACCFWGDLRVFH